MQATRTKSAIRAVNIFDVPGAGVVRVLPKPTAQFKAVQKAREALFGPSLLPVGRPPEELTAFSLGKTAGQTKVAMPVRSAFSPIMSAMRTGRLGKYKAPVGFETVASNQRPGTGWLNNFTRGAKRVLSPTVTRSLYGAAEGGYIGAGVDAAIEYPGMESYGIGAITGTLAGAANPWLSRAMRRSYLASAAKGTPNPLSAVRWLKSRNGGRDHVEKWVTPPLKRLSDLATLGMIQYALTGGEANFMRMSQTANETSELYKQRLVDIYNGNTP